ncbi:hypothetical protein BDV98DRAFT_653693 [Pterulicium gracile]|uniref:Uncharacterized protein n=1 Tax=Pterulicium gracile TaxID=1884261 RepID=A0A5C3QWT9_9AGAR|nr:hypothetical protein BDV98DRAFT_653693 [Pterula gracilis]
MLDPGQASMAQTTIKEASSNPSTISKHQHLELVSSSNMQSTIFLTLLASVNVALAGLVPASFGDLQARQQPDLALLACTGAKYEGCSPFPMITAPACGDFSFHPEFDNSISSFRFFSGGSFCLLFRDPGCKGANLADTVPHANLTQSDPYFDNALSSYQCFFTGG